MKLRSLLIAIMACIPLAAQTSYNDGIVSPANNPTHLAPRYAYVREGDVMWAKRIWRVVDFREKINQYFLYPLNENNNRINLIQVLMEGIKQGVITPFDPFLGDDFKVKMTTSEALNIGNKYDTIQVYDYRPPYDYLRDSVIRESFDAFNVRKIKIKEDWFFDMKRSVMEVRIVGICPVMDVYDENTGELRGQQDMYWIHFEEARSFLATYKIYNPYNYGNRISYDDAFIKRMFSSLIYKEDNTQDRRIADYMKGMDALYESEDVKNKIFLFESDVWEQ